MNISELNHELRGAESIMAHSQLAIPKDATKFVDLHKQCHAPSVQLLASHLNGPAIG